MRLEHVLVVARPIEEVFDYLVDVANLPAWQTSVVSAELDGEGPPGAGARFRETRTFMGRRLESVVEVTEWERPRRFCLRTVSGPLPYDVRHTLEPGDGGTRIRFELEGRPRGVMRLAGGVAERTALRQSQADFARLKALLEARP